MSLTPDASYTPPVSPAPTVLDQRAAVANLSRNIVIQGADDAAWSGGGALLGDATGHILRNSTVWQSANRCVVLHATNGVQVLNNVCQDIAGHAFFLEDAVERRNVFDGNLALTMRSPPTARLLQVHEGPNVFQGGPAGFWLTNPDNIVRNNLAADAAGNGFWLAFPRMALGLSALVNILPDRTRLGAFHDNVAHSNRKPGINLDWAPTNAAGNVAPNQYTPTTTDAEVNGNNFVRTEIRRITSYKNLGGALWNRITAPDYPEWVTADNTGVHFAGAGAAGVITRALLVGTSLNNPTPYPSIHPFDPPSAFATYHSAFSMYDNTVVNFPFVEGQSSGMFRTNDYYTNGVDKGLARNTNNRMINSHPGYRSLPPLLDGQPLNFRHYTFSGALWDANGYWGPAGNFWVYDVPFLTTGSTCQAVLPAGQNSQSCSGEYYGVEKFQTDFDNNRYTFSSPIDIERQNADGTTIGHWSVPDGATSSILGNMRHFAARPGGRYVLRFPHRTTAGQFVIPNWFAMTVTNAFRAGDSMLMAVAFDGTVNAGGYTVAGHLHQRDTIGASNPAVRAFTHAANLDAVIAGSNGNLLWQDTVNHLVWFKFQGNIAYPNAANLVPNSDEDIDRPFSVLLRATPPLERPHLQFFYFL